MWEEGEKKADPSSSFAPFQNMRLSSQEVEAINDQSTEEQGKDTLCPTALSKPENIWPEGSREPNCASRFLKDCLFFFILLIAFEAVIALASAPAAGHQLVHQDSTYLPAQHH